MNGFCQVNPLDGRREAPDSKRMESAAMAWREASTPSPQISRALFASAEFAWLGDSLVFFNSLADKSINNDL
jgi:hypothetical protein